MFKDEKRYVEKTELHPRNAYRKRYDFADLEKHYPVLKEFTKKNPYGDISIDFFNPKAVKALNTALLYQSYDIEYWDFPDDYLCPPIPGRADYIHHLADLLSESNKNKTVKCLDIGTGANCIYPIIGVGEYSWNFVASDIDAIAVSSARKIVDLNPALKSKIEIRIQDNPKHTFSGIIQKTDFFDLSICNPPFHRSKKMAEETNLRKLQNLKADTNVLNFSGKSNELWCKGGEKMFIKRMIKESQKFANSCQWFTSLVSKKENLNSFYEALKIVNAKDVRTIEMGQGHKKSRILAWTFN